MFRRTVCAAALPAAFLVPFSAAHAEEHVHELEPVVVTGNPLGSSLLELATPISTVNQDALSRSGATTLGEVLSGIPGVGASSFGPNASRPVIRGLDADRVRILQNGVGNMDVSALSPDHAVPMDPLVIDQIEVVRGPAALLYGGSAVGGVVNAIDNRIPQESLSGVTGRAEIKHGGAEQQSSGAVVMEAGNGSVALHLDAFKRSSDELRIPGYARSSRLRATDPQPSEAKNRLPNSSAHADGAALGAAYTFADGYAGLSFSGYNSNYGTVAEEAVRIRMKSDRIDFASEVRELDGFFTKLKFRFANTDYQHQELDAGVVATTFKNRGNEGMIEATHRKIGNMTGVIGFSAMRGEIEAIGDEALLPRVRQRNQAAYLYEELPLSTMTLSFGGRIERAGVRGDGGGPIDPNTGNPRFGAAADLSFTPKSAAFGAVIPLGQAYSLASSLSHTERAPSFNELLAHGPHAATGQYEIGNRHLKVEKSHGIDLQLRWKQGRNSASLGAFYTRFANFISLFGTGNARDEDGLINNVNGEFAEAVVRAVPAQFSGLEAEGKFHIYEGRGDLDLRLKADMVRAKNRDTGEPLPRIAPRHLGVGLDYRLERFGARVDAIYGARQDRVADNELPTDSYVQLNAMLTWKLRSELPNAELFLRANNLLNEDIRLHASVLKDRAPMDARSLMLGLRAGF